MLNKTSLFNFADNILDQCILFSFDRTGYQLRKSFWNPQDMDVDLSQKTILITGANSGLGYATAEYLAKKGAALIMGCRSLERGETARQKLIAASQNQKIYLEHVDISLMASVRHFVEIIEQKYTRIDILINNAGALLNTRQETSEGLEASFASNLLGPYLLTSLLIPLLKKSSPSRVIMVSSGGMYLTPLTVNDLQFQRRSYHGATAYAEAKRGQVILSKLWAHAYQDSGIIFNAMHPGWADTPGIQKSLPLFRNLTRLILRNSSEGADTINWMASKPRFLESGAFFFDRKSRRTHRSDKTRNSLSEIEQFWQQLGTLSECLQDFPFLLKL